MFRYLGMSKAIAATIMAVAVLSARAAMATPISIDDLDTYTQDFSGLQQSGTGNYTTVPEGWAFYEQLGNTTYKVDTGGLTTGNTYSYGSSGSSDRAFGSLTSTSIPTIYLGAEFVNNTGTELIGVDIGYTGEQWRDDNTLSDTLTFEYSLDAISLTDATAEWTAVTSLDFTSPKKIATGALNGNLAANRTVIEPVSITFDTAVANEEGFWVRWKDSNIASADHGLAIDDFSLTAVPEPSALALLAVGLASLWFVSRQRRR